MIPSKQIALVNSSTVWILNDGSEFDDCFEVIV